MLVADAPAPGRTVAPVPGRTVAPSVPGRIVAASTPLIAAAFVGELGVSNNDARIFVPQPAQNSPSGGSARPHFEQKEGASMSVIASGVLALWSLCQFAVQNVVFPAPKGGGF